jgi:RNA polymerase sigma factor (sigma-70 family)
MSQTRDRNCFTHPSAVILPPSRDLSPLLCKAAAPRKGPLLQVDERRRFEDVMLPHINAAYNLARWLTQDEHAAEDVVQEAYFRAARYFASFRGGDGRPWLLGVVRRTAFDWFSDHRGKGAVTFDEDLHDRGDNSSDPFQVAIRKSDQLSVRRALEELPLPLREVLVLRELEGMTYQQIATSIEVPIGTVMSRLKRGRAQLQWRLAAVVGGERK